LKKGVYLLEVTADYQTNLQKTLAGKMVTGINTNEHVQQQPKCIVKKKIFVYCLIVLNFFDANNK